MYIYIYISYLSLSLFLSLAIYLCKYSNNGTFEGGCHIQFSSDCVSSTGHRLWFNNYQQWLCVFASEYVICLLWFIEVSEGHEQFVILTCTMYHKAFEQVAFVGKPQQVRKKM